MRFSQKRAGRRCFCPRGRSKGCVPTHLLPDGDGASERGEGTRSAGDQPSGMERWQLIRASGPEVRTRRQGRQLQALGGVEREKEERERGEGGAGGGGGRASLKAVVWAPTGGWAASCYSGWAWEGTYSPGAQRVPSKWPRSVSFQTRPAWPRRPGCRPVSLLGPEPLKRAPEKETKGKESQPNNTPSAELRSRPGGAAGRWQLLPLCLRVPGSPGGGSAPSTHHPHQTPSWTRSVTEVPVPTGPTHTAVPSMSHP